MKTNKYMKALAVFFILMIILSIISRAADSVTVARVVTEKIRRSALVHQTICDGTIETSEKVYVQGEKEFRMKKIHVEEGNHVNAGDLLFTLDHEELSDQASQLQSDIKAIHLNLEKLRIENHEPLSNQLEVDQAELALLRAKSDDAIATELNDGKQMLKNKREIEDAQEKLRVAKASLNDEKKQLEEEKKRNDIDIQLKELELQEKEEELDKLQRLLRVDGEIKAGVAGTVAELFVKQGAIMSGEDLCAIIPDDADYEFQAEIDTDDAKYMKVGDPISITLSGKSVPMKDIVIKSLKSTNGKTKITADILKKEGLGNGMQGSMEHKHMTDEYDEVLPLSAIRGSESSEYVLVVREKSTVLGTEKIAEKVAVEVLDKDNKNASIEGNLELTDQVIKASSKPIGEGDRVREQESKNL